MADHPEKPINAPAANPDYMTSAVPTTSEAAGIPLDTMTNEKTATGREASGTHEAATSGSAPEVPTQPNVAQPEPIANTTHDPAPPSYSQHQNHKAVPPPAVAAPGAPPNAAAPAAPVTPLRSLSPDQQGQWIDCPLCQRRTRTQVVTQGSSTQIVVGAVLCLVCICLACVPCMAHWFEDTEWRCASCKGLVARKSSDGPITTFGPAEAAQVPSQYAATAPMEARNGAPTRAPEATQ